ncbi:RNA 3'-terminal phosphate cyclase [Candidatus Woesearchaeota archaeon]|nr:RNA 3'-terminal phosphate cyclase [Candidatus Woesearchaeota archaeon]
MTIKIDGSYLEGGGQIIRTGLAFSTLLGKNFSVDKIRQGRKVPGLKPQHMHAILALKDLSGAKTDDITVGSCSLEYNPGKLKPRTLSVDIGTAGSITLLLQSLWLPLILFPGTFRLKFKGGTDTKWSMPIDYLAQVFVPQIQRYADITVKLIRRGYYPRGGGEVDIRIKGKYSFDTISEGAPQINLTEQGILLQIKGVSHASLDLEKDQVAERQARAAKNALLRLDVPVHIDLQYSETLSTGSGITLWAIFSKSEDDVDVHNPIRLGADSLGEKGKKAEVVGEEAARKLLEEIESGAAVDRHLADNLVPFLAVFGGEIKTSVVTDHTKTNIYAAEQFLGKRIEIVNTTIRRI